jgi:hypothetical protein
MQPAVVASTSVKAAAPRPITGIIELLVQNRAGLDLGLAVFVLATEILSLLKSESAFHLIMAPL